MLLTLYKFFLVAWPFVKEVLLGGKDIKHEARKNKTATALFVVNICLFVLFIYSLDQAAIYSNKTRALHNELGVLKVRLENAEASTGVPKERLESLEQALETYKTNAELYRDTIDELKQDVLDLEGQNANLIAEITKLSPGSGAGTKEKPTSDRYARISARLKEIENGEENLK